MSPGRTPSTATSSATWNMRWTRPDGSSRTQPPTAARRRKTGCSRTAALTEVPGLWPAGLHAGLLCAEPGYAFRASAGPARTQARPTAPAGGPQAGQPGAIRQQLGYAAGTRNRDDRPDPATGQRQPLSRPTCRGIVRHAAHDLIILRSPSPQPPGPSGPADQPG